MTDEELAKTVAVALRERFPTPDGVELRVAKPVRPKRMRVVLAVAATVVAVAVLAAMLARRSSTTHPATPSYVDQLTGITWRGALPILTLVFTDHTMRIYDGCSNELHSVTIGRGTLDIGGLIGKTGVCGGTPGGPSAAVSHFDAVVSSRHLSWSRVHGMLFLSNSRGMRLQLGDVGRALEASGQDWVLHEYLDPRGYSHVGKYSAARLRIDHGTVRASDFCGAITGTASVTDDMITFSDMQSGGSCTARDSAKADPVIRAVLNGNDEYAIRGNELIIYSRHQLLVYVPA